MNGLLIDRRVVLGGESTGRGIVGGVRSRLEWAGMAATGVWVVPLVLGGVATWGRIAAAGAVLVAAFVFWTPFEGPLRGRSAAAWTAHAARFEWNRRRGGAVFVPAYAQREAVPATSGEQPAVSRAKKPAGVFDVPVVVGNARVIGTVQVAGGALAVVRHSNPGRTHFLTAALEMRGEPTGQERDHDFGRAYEGWGAFCATLAGDASFVRGLQQVSRVVPYDTADHSMWVGRHVPPGTSALLTDSYVELLDTAAAMTEQHRTWLVLRLPVTPRFALEARRLGAGAQGELALARREVVAAMHRAAGYGIDLRPLDEARLGAVLRSLQDPDHPIDMVAGMDWARGWLAWDARDRRDLVVTGTERSWHTRTAVITARQVQAGHLAPNFLSPLVSGVSPSVVRTLSVMIDLVPAHAARAKAKSDVTLDIGRAREAARQVSDGSAEQQLTASQQRLADLRVGTGYHGANWSMTVTLCTADLEELDAATRQIEAAAEASHITGLRWLDGWQEAGLAAGLPLARGMAVRR
ncbi:SCO6880 family protein [Actinotalea sp. K2]|uniref:SCO6880 family protein n=1 Tax=Actinotalea sp. K2 TaxID=2939438 RepID=UPI002017D0B1|nr:SCO6880 family protein [Actinotalea sp. K2]MCL3863029.1 hypothetical protein [Actinotalea sp. K2]